MEEKGAKECGLKGLVIVSKTPVIINRGRKNRRSLRATNCTDYLIPVESSSRAPLIREYEITVEQSCASQTTGRTLATYAAKPYQVIFAQLRPTGVLDIEGLEYESFKDFFSFCCSLLH